MLDNRTETFLAVCHEMSFTKAARTLHVSQPAVSQHIQYLEDYYGTKLFRFEGKKIFLTDAGELLRETTRSTCGNSFRCSKTRGIRSASAQHSPSEST